MTTHDTPSVQRRWAVSATHRHGLVLDHLPSHHSAMHGSSHGSTRLLIGHIATHATPVQRQRIHVAGREHLLPADRSDRRRCYATFKKRRATRSGGLHKRLPLTTHHARAHSLAQPGLALPHRLCSAVLDTAGRPLRAAPTHSSPHSPSE